MKKLPKISVITPTLNAATYLPFFLKQVKKQKYPQNKIEIIVADGGSTDNTIAIAKKYKTVIIPNPYILGQAGVWVGMKKATGDLCVVLAGDNIFKEDTAFQKIAEVFNREDIYAAFPKQGSSKNDSLFTKYQNLFTDPFNHFVYGNAANARTFHKVYRTVEKNKLFTIYDYNSSDIQPILGLAQGFTVRKEFIKKWKEKYDDILPIIKIIKENKKIAYMQNVTLYHHTIRDFNHFFRKQRWAVKNALEKTEMGIGIREKTLTPWQKVKMYLYPVYGFSIIAPILVGIYGAIRDKTLIWLYHPLVIIPSAFAIVYEYILFKIGISKSVSRL